MKIRTVRDSDLGAITEIYNHFIQESTATFEEQPLVTNDLSQRVQETLASGFPWIVLEVEGDVIGYAYAKPWHTRSAYRFTAESTIYMASNTGGKGYGRKLYQELMSLLEAKGIKNVMGVITQPNPASVHLHESIGFRKAGEFKNIGFKFGRQLSVGYWQLEMGC
ncbi:GNAT family N-acetyltransferase [Vibrio hannami]|uniref:GNAT family N-acetyltransferase n=1 Tax=Vibrio hannami TaxID=2717094 RepID=UPI00240F34CE|nr:GNAT family N-acetyltransferase [Vibrio hannami]MDG3088460.1 GNAT family N-acetyltransferase [Vibrio hannami]